MKRFTFLLSLMVLVFLASIILAGIPEMINYQGMLTDDSGDPITDTLDLKFRIYNSGSSGTLKWSETQLQVPIIDGLFNVILGSINLIDTLSFSEQYWLEVQVDNDTMPRIRFTSVGYAYRAWVADSAAVAGSGGGGGWVDDGNVIRLQSGTDSVGIGTTSPIHRLEVKSSGYTDGMSVTSSDDDQLFRVRQNSDGSDQIQVSDSAGDVRVLVSGGPGAYFDAGTVAIRTSNPNSNLHVNGSMAMAYRYVSENYTATSLDCIIAVNAASGVRHIYLPSALGIPGRVYTVKKLDSSYNNVRVEPFGDETIDGFADWPLADQGNYVTVVSNGASWMIIANGR